MIPTNLNFPYPTNLELYGLESSLEKFINFPSSTSSTTKDEIISRLIEKLGIQGRTFKVITEMSLTKCEGKFSTLTTNIIQTLEKFDKDPGNNRPDLIIAELSKDCDSIKKGYKDISSSLQMISSEFQSHKFNIQKEQTFLLQSITNLRYKIRQEKFCAIKTGIIFGFGIGSLSNFTTVMIKPQFDCGLTLFASVFTGGLLGWYYGNKMGLKFKSEIFDKEQQLGHLRRDSQYVDNVIDNIKIFKDGVNLFETYWSRQLDHMHGTFGYISNVKKGTMQMNGITVQSFLISWAHAKNSFDNYKTAVNSLAS